MQQDSFRTSSMRFCANVCTKRMISDGSTLCVNQRKKSISGGVEIFLTGPARYGVEQSS